MHRKGASALIVNKKSEFLLVNLESFEDKYFAIPGGGVEKEETLKDAVYRELNEELGIKQKDLQLIGQSDIPLNFKFKEIKMNRDGVEYEGSERYFFGFKFTGDESDIKLQEGEIRFYKWVSYDDLKDYLLFDNQLQETLEKIKEIFSIDSSHISLIPYQRSWADKFETEKDNLQKIFNDRAISIEHIGSTSIPGLSAKPIIDIAVLIEKREEGDSFIELVGKLDYQYDKLNSSGERHFFRKGSPTEFHLSIAYKDKGSFWERQILFRDYLRSHPDSRDEYQKLKENLLQDDLTGKDSYLSGKSEFVNRVLSLAMLQGKR
jgi:GrpB-like predicted nucleotidyltransferase (UPF0157 family)/8-oxo-dGTP pyrophosphatase MutT (NUDIX family)